MSDVTNGPDMNGLDVMGGVLDVIATRTPVPRGQLDPSARLADLEIASLDVVEIVFALEDRFDIQIPYNANTAAPEFVTIGDVIRAVEAVVRDGTAAG